jgi:hypothetical protein
MKQMSCLLINSTKVHRAVSSFLFLWFSETGTLTPLNVIISAPGCHRQNVPGRRVTACEAVKDWEKVVKRHFDEKGSTLHSHGHDEL